MTLSRRKLLGDALCGAVSLSAAPFVLSACDSRERPDSRPVVLGLVSSIREEQEFPIQRVLVRRDRRGLRATSLVCTHQVCVVRRQSPGFICPCHGSQFDGEGRVTIGPASRDLPHYALSIDSEGRLIANLGVEVGADWRLAV